MVELPSTFVAVSVYVVSCSGRTRRLCNDPTAHVVTPSVTVNVLAKLAVQRRTVAEPRFTVRASGAKLVTTGRVPTRTRTEAVEDPSGVVAESVYVVSASAFVCIVDSPAGTAAPFTESEVAGGASFQRNSTAPPGSTSAGKAAKLAITFRRTCTGTGCEDVEPCEFVAVSTYEVVESGDTWVELPVTSPGDGCRSSLSARSTFQVKVTGVPRRIRSLSAEKRWMDGGEPQAAQSTTTTRRALLTAVLRSGKGTPPGPRRRSGWNCRRGRLRADTRGSRCRCRGLPPDRGDRIRRASGRNRDRPCRAPPRELRRPRD